MKRILTVLFALVLVLSFTACAKEADKTTEAEEADETTVEVADNDSSQEVFELKLASMFPPEMPETIALYKFEEILEEQSNGRIDLEIYPNCQLGPEEVFTDSLIEGSVDMAIPGTTMAKHFSSIAIGECPFLFKDWDHARSVFTGPIGEEVFDGLVEEVGVRGFGFTPMGFSIIASTDEPITTYEDLKDRRFRIPPIAHFIEFAKAINTNPVPNMLTEFYTSLEQGVADSCGVPYSILKSTKVYELTPYIVETNDIMFTHGWYINEESYQKLPEDLQQILSDSITEAQNFLWDLAIETEIKDKEFLISEGIEIYIPDEEFKQKMMDSRESVHAWFIEEYPGVKPLIEKIKSAE